MAKRDLVRSTLLYWLNAFCVDIEISSIILVFWHRFGVGVVCEESWPDSECVHEDSNEDEEWFYDDVSGATLPPELIQKGREDELKHIDELKVWELKPIR